MYSDYQHESPPAVQLTTADLNTLPLLLAIHGRIHERRMRNTPRSLSVSNRIKTLDEQALARLHTVTVVPCLFRIVLEVEEFEAVTYVVLVSRIASQRDVPPLTLGQGSISHATILGREIDRDRDEVFILSCPGIAEAERILLTLI